MTSSKGVAKRMRRPRALPLRTWLLVLLVLISGLGLAGSAGAVYSIMRDVLYSRTDQELVDATNTWARNINTAALVFDQGRRPPTEFVAVVYQPDGSFLYTGPDGAIPDVRDLYVGGRPDTVPSLSGETQWRAIAVEDNGNVVVVAKDLTTDRATLRGLALVEVIITAVVMLLLALIGMWLLHRALRPLRVVEKTASQIAAGDLDRRVPEWPLHTEVGQLSQALNIMLAKLQRAVVDARDKEEQMRRFVGDASHELRTPLTSLHGYTELYRSGATQDAEFVLSKIDAESQRMSLLVEDLLALTRAEGSRLNLRPVDVLELALAVGSTARAAFPGREIRVRNEAREVPLVLGDADRLHQVVLNLVSNGVRHGGPQAQVTVTVRAEDERVLIDVADDGKGMTPEDCSHIFERFYRADSSRARDTGGTGLGLAIVKSLVEQHGGDITVESAPGRGSVFTVSLPRSR